MFITKTMIRVHYALTDQMGFVYHGNYAQFYEIGRTEAIRTLGFTYKDIEAMGIIMPVVDIHSCFIRPARYDDLLTVTTTLRELPTNHKIIFYSEIFNEASELLNTGTVCLFFMELKSMQKTNIPPELKVKVEKYFT